MGSTGNAGRTGIASRQHRREHREALAMGLYVSVTLLATLAVPHGDVLLVVWGTTVGLALAHWFTFELAARLVDRSIDGREVTRQLRGQLGAAAAVGVLATVPLVLLPEDLEQTGARVAAASAIGVASFGEALVSGASRMRSLGIAAVALVLGLVVAAVMFALGH